PHRLLVRRSPLEVRTQLLLQTLLSGQLPGVGSRRLEQLQAADVVVSHAPKELVIDVIAEVADRQYRPAQRRAVAEDVVGLVASLVGDAELIDGLCGRRPRSPRRRSEAAR